MSDEHSPSTERLPPGAGDRVQIERAFLTVLDGSQAGRKIPLDEGPVLLGTAEGCQARLQGRGISKRHAQLLPDRGRVMIRDLESTNGTFLNGSRIREAFLRSADIVTLGDLRLRFEAHIEHLRIPPSTHDRFGPLFGTSAPMRQLFGVLEKVAPTDASVLIQGESGSGKDLVARALHQSSRRSDRPFVVVDASAHTAELVASELFGHMEGAFTGATQRQAGVFEVAEGGTVFLDEIGELPRDLQPKFLRVLENREVRPIGSSKTIPVDVRIVAATNRDLAAMVQRGEFREDLYYRLAVVQVRIPPLRERREDLPGLVATMLSTIRRNSDPVRLTPEALDILASQSWRGNVRELRNVLERTIALTTSEEIDVKDLMMSERVESSVSQEPGEHPGSRSAPHPVDSLLGQTLDDIQREVVRRTLQLTNGNQAETARRLGLHRNGLAKMLRRYRISPTDGSSK